MRPRPSPPALRRPLAAVLVGALLLTQVLGWLHRVVHAHGPHPGVAAHAVEAPGSSLAALFAHHHDEADCQVFDQISHGDSVSPSVIEADSLRLGQPMALEARGCAVAAQAAGYLARGPPGTV